MDISESFGPWKRSHPDGLESDYFYVIGDVVSFQVWELADGFELFSYTGSDDQRFDVEPCSIG